MRSATHAKDEPAGRIKAENVVVAGVLMPCEYVSNSAGRVRVLMLADVELDASGARVRWHRTLNDATRFAFGQIEPCRKISILVASDRLARPAFRQVLKRDLSATASDAGIERSATSADAAQDHLVLSSGRPCSNGMR